MWPKTFPNTQKRAIHHLYMANFSISNYQKSLSPKQSFYKRCNQMSGMSRTVSDTRIRKPHLRCFVCCLLGSINTMTYSTDSAREALHRENGKCLTWEVLWLLMRWRLQSSPHHWNESKSLQRNKHGKHCSQQSSTITTGCNQVPAGENGCQPGTRSQMKTWETWLYECMWMSKTVMDWWNSEVETQCLSGALKVIPYIENLMYCMSGLESEIQ